MENFDFNEMMKMVSKMDKKELEEKMAQVSKMLGSKSPEQIMRELNGNGNSKKK